jgi:hypothetical protein
MIHYYKYKLESFRSEKNDSLLQTGDMGARRITAKRKEESSGKCRNQFLFQQQQQQQLAGWLLDPGSCRLGPPGAAIDPRPAPRGQGGVANSSNCDAFVAVPMNTRARVRGMIHNNNTSTTAEWNIFMSFPLRINSHNNLRT